MFEKDTNTTDKYKINPSTTVTVKNTRRENLNGDTSYGIQVTLKYHIRKDSPLTFSDFDDIADFMNNINYENDQLTIPGTDRQDLK